MKPVWPDLVEVIRESPALILPGQYFIAEVTDLPVSTPTLMTFHDDVECTVIVGKEHLQDLGPLRSRGPYAVIRLQLAKPFITPGLLASAASAVALMKVTQLLYSSYSFDYVLVEESNLEPALSGLEQMGFPVDRRLRVSPVKAPS